MGKAETMRQGRHVALLALGELVHPTLEAAGALAAQGIECEVVNMRFAKPLDTELLRDVASRFSSIVTLENNVRSGGFGSAVCEYLAAENITGVRVHNHAIPDRFVDHGSPAELASELRFDSTGIVSLVTEFLSGAR
jgi:1-deoxy-D-xylulose-5-phosphate synthase